MKQIGPVHTSLVPKADELALCLLRGIVPTGENTVGAAHLSPASVKPERVSGMLYTKPFGDVVSGGLIHPYSDLLYYGSLFGVCSETESPYAFKIRPFPIVACDQPFETDCSESPILGSEALYSGYPRNRGTFAFEKDGRITGVMVPFSEELNFYRPIKDSEADSFRAYNVIVDSDDWVGTVIGLSLSLGFGSVAAAAIGRIYWNLKKDATPRRHDPSNVAVGGIRRPDQTPQPPPVEMTTYKVTVDVDMASTTSTAPQGYKRYQMNNIEALSVTTEETMVAQQTNGSGFQIS